MTTDFLKGIPTTQGEGTIVSQTLIELRLMKLGIPYETIQNMSKAEIGLYLGTSTALEEKENQDQLASQRTASAKARMK